MPIIVYDMYARGAAAVVVSFNLYAGGGGGTGVVVILEVGLDSNDD